MNGLGALVIPLAVLLVAVMFIRHRRRLGFGSRAYACIVGGLLAIVVCDTLIGLQSVALAGRGADHWAIAPWRGVIVGLAVVTIALGVMGWLPTLMSAADSLRRVTALDRISRAVRRSTGEALYQRLAAEVAGTLDAYMVFIGLLSPERTHITTLAVWRRGGPAKNFTYALAGSPCAGVIVGETSIFPKGVAQCFPEDRALAEMGIEGYAGNGLMGSNGQPIGLFAVLTQAPMADPTLAEAIVQVFSDRIAVELERERAMQALAESRDQLLEAQSMAQIGHWRASGQLLSSVWSPAIFAMTGITPCEPVDVRKVLDLMSPEAREAYLARRQQAINRHERFDADVLIRRPDGEERWLAVLGKPAPGSTPEAPTYIGLIQDITTRKRHEMELLDAYAAKTQFIAIMSHELRTPLIPIRGFAEILADPAQEHLPAATRQSYAAEIVTAAENMGHLVEDILDLTDIELNNLTLTRTDTDICALVVAVAQQVATQIDAAGLILSLDLPKMPVLLHVDRRRLRQVLFNLVSNAMKFTGRGGQIALRVVLPPGSVLLSVADTGVGMAETDIQRLLQPFCQGESGLNRSASGLGLGLAISKALTEAHGGTMRLVSAPGAGTCVTLSFPR